MRKALDAIKAEDPTFNYEIEAPPPAHYKVQTVYMEPFDVPNDLPIVKCLEENFRGFAGRDPGPDWGGNHAVLCGE